MKRGASAYQALLIYSGLLRFADCCSEPMGHSSSLRRVPLQTSRCSRFGSAARPLTISYPTAQHGTSREPLQTTKVDQIEKTIVSLLCLLTTTAMTQRCPSVPASKTIMGLMRNSCTLCSSKPSALLPVPLSVTSRLGVAHAITRLIGDVAVHHMPWYVELIKGLQKSGPGASSSITTASSSGAFLGYVACAIAGLMGESSPATAKTPAAPSSDSEAAGQAPWPLFHAGLKLFQTVQLSIDERLTKKNKSLVPAQHQQVALHFVAGNPTIRPGSGALGTGINAQAPPSSMSTNAVRSTLSSSCSSSNSSTSPKSVASIASDSWLVPPRVAEDVLQNDQVILPHLIESQKQHYRSKKFHTRPDRPEGMEGPQPKRRRAEREATSLPGRVDTLLMNADNGLIEVEKWARVRFRGRGGGNGMEDIRRELQQGCET